MTKPDTERTIRTPRLVLEPQRAEHAEAMFAVHTLLAVYKRSNTASRRLLERQGFAVAEAGDPLRPSIEADEDLMRRPLAATVAR